MKLFRKHHTPEAVGAMIYESLRAGIATSGALSFSGFLREIAYEPGEIPETAEGETIIGAMFAATLAIERSGPRAMGRGVIHGMESDFLAHLREQGAPENQVIEWGALFRHRADGYQRVLEGYDGWEPPWKLGREFLWNVIGHHDYNALAVKAATFYLLAARDRAQDILNAYGPTILPPRAA